MNRDDYGRAYQKGFQTTIRFLVSRGVPVDSAQEVAQAAWVKGWERREQLRDPKLVYTWMNSIAWNIHRSHLRRAPQMMALFDMPCSGPEGNIAAIDASRILRTCKGSDRLVLQQHYIEGRKAQEIADRQGWTETAVRIRLMRARRTAAAMNGGLPAAAPQ